MKVLVTGGCGFAGTNVCEYYRNRGEEAVAFDNLAKHELMRTGYVTDLARTHNYDHLRKLGMQIVKGDVRNRDEVYKAAQDCDFIVHTAAQPAMTISIEDPELDFATNAVGTLNVLLAARKFDSSMVYCSTIHVYGNKINDTLKEGKTRYLREPPAIDEEHPIMQGTLTPLHASKRTAELYVQTFIDTYGLKAAVFRLTGLYGPRQFGGEDHGWVANFTIRTTLGWPVTIYGTGKQVRDILYISDLTSAFNAFHTAQKPGIYNIGNGFENSISLIECLKLIEETTGRKAKVKYGPERLGDLRYFVCDTSKAKRLLNWEPKISPREGVSKLAAWIEQNKELFNGQRQTFAPQNLDNIVSSK